MRLTLLTLLGLASSTAGATALDNWAADNPVAIPGDIRAEAWWNREQSGWGVFTSVFDNATSAFWYTYDEAGQPTWFIVSGLRRDTDGYHDGSVTRHTGIPFDAESNAGAGMDTEPFAAAKIAYSVGPFDGRPVQNVLRFAVQPTDSERVLVHDRLEFFELGEKRIHCRQQPGLSRVEPVNLTDIYWNPANPGWGLQVLHYDQSVVGVWYTYEGDGRAVFFTLTLVEVAPRVFEGEIFRNNEGLPYSEIESSLFGSTPAHPVSDAVTRIGTARIEMQNGQAGTFSYVVGGRSYSQPVTRFQSGSSANHCEESRMRGDYWHAEPALKDREDVLYFGGYEAGAGDGISWAETAGVMSISRAENLSTPSVDPAFGRSLSIRHPAGDFGGAFARTFLSNLGHTDSYDHLFLRYHVRFGSSFEWVKGGKMPGIGANVPITGCNHVDGTNGWSMRFMWRANGRMVQYTYLPPPLRIGDCGFDLQLSVPRTPPLQAQPYILQDDAWYCVEQEVKLNDAGSANGAVNVWINGIQVLGLSNVVYRTVENWETQIGGIAFDSHFGGGDATWHPSTDQYVYYDNVVLAESRIGCAQQ